MNTQIKKALNLKAYAAETVGFGKTELELFKSMIQHCADHVEVQAEVAKAKEKADGVRTRILSAVVTGDLCPNLETFVKVQTALYTAIRMNRGGLADVLKSEPLPAPDEKTGATHKIGQEVMNICSLIRGSFEHGVALTDDKGAARPVSHIAKEVKAARNVKKRETATGAAALRIACRDELEAISTLIPKLTEQGLQDALKVLRGAHQVIRKDTEHKATKGVTTATLKKAAAKATLVASAETPADVLASVTGSKSKPRSKAKAKKTA